MRGSSGLTPHSSLLDCDVVIVNHNAGALLATSVQSALAERARRVVVVDNDSRDDSLSLLAAALSDERLSIARQDRNLGFAAGCNIGLNSCGSAAVLFLNPDCVLGDGSLRRMITVLDADASIGMVGGLLCNPDGSEQRGGRRQFPTPVRAFSRVTGLSGLARRFVPALADFSLHGTLLPSRPTEVDAISGACMLVRRRAIEEVGWWDEGYFLHCEDLDWCLRFRRRGWRVVFVPDARATHAAGACSRGRRLFVEWHKHRGMLRFYRKHYKDRYPVVLWGLVAAGVWLRLGLIALWLSGAQLVKREGRLRP